MSAFEADLEAALDGDSGDVTVETQDGGLLRAHSQILQLCSPVLRAELTGMMQEAQTRHLTMDCDRHTAVAFLRFLYIGRVIRAIASELEVVLGLVRLADYYGVIEQFAAAFAQDEAQEAFAALLENTMGKLPDPSAYGAEILSQLRPLIMQRKSLAAPVVERLKLRFGWNVFKCLCHARARVLPEVQEACQRINFPAREANELHMEVNEATVAVLLDMYPEMPAVVLHALLDFISLLAGKLPGACRSRPAVGHLIRTRAGSRPDGPLASGAVGELIRDDKSACPFLVKVAVIHAEINDAFLAHRWHADWICPGWEEKLGRAEDKLLAQAASFDWQMNDGAGEIKDPFRDLQDVFDGTIGTAKSHAEIKDAFLAHQWHADFIYPGWKVKLGHGGDLLAWAAKI